MINNKVTELLKIEHPIIQAPMASGITTSELVALFTKMTSRSFLFRIH
nr:hypothetical protein [Fredinandcohnia onubensis]